MPDRKFHLHTLGEFSLRRSTPPQEIVLRASKPLMIVALLAMAPRLTARREHIAALLWPDSSPARARRSLRQALFYLAKSSNGNLVRNGTPHGVLELDGDALWVDAWEFERALRDRRYSRALELYRGEFLTSMRRKVGPEVVHLIQAENSRLRAGLEVAYTRLVHRRLDEGRVQEAIAYARDYATRNPKSERAQATLIRTLKTGGYELEALGAYRAYCALMRTDEAGRGESAGGGPDRVREEVFRSAAGPQGSGRDGQGNSRVHEGDSAEALSASSGGADAASPGVRSRLQRALGRVAGALRLDQAYGWRRPGDARFR